MKKNCISQNRLYFKKSHSSYYDLTTDLFKKPASPFKDSIVRVGKDLEQKGYSSLSFSFKNMTQKNF